jgi:hypothetical protein
MQEIDEVRWRALLAALANAKDTSPSFGLLQEAQGRWARAHSDLEQYRSRGPSGQPDLRNVDMAASFARGVAELEQRVADADREVKRVDGLLRETNARHNVLAQQVDGVRAWARQQSITLPGDDEISMGGFSASSTRIATPPGREPFGMSSAQPAVAPRQGGTRAATERPAPRVHPGTSGVVRMMGRIWP